MDVFKQLADEYERRAKLALEHAQGRGLADAPIANTEAETWLAAARNLRRAIAAACIALSACGGGGSNDAPTVRAQLATLDAQAESGAITLADGLALGLAITRDGRKRAQDFAEYDDDYGDGGGGGDLGGGGGMGGERERDPDDLPTPQPPSPDRSICTPTFCEGGGRITNFLNWFFIYSRGYYSTPITWVKVGSRGSIDAELKKKAYQCALAVGLSEIDPASEDTGTVCYGGDFGLLIAPLALQSPQTALGNHAPIPDTAPPPPPAPEPYPWEQCEICGANTGG